MGLLPGKNELADLAARGVVTAKAAANELNDMAGEFAGKIEQKIKNAGKQSPDNKPGSFTDEAIIRGKQVVDNLSAKALDFAATVSERVKEIEAARPGKTRKTQQKGPENNNV
jgi:hypothetical protein